MQQRKTIYNTSHGTVAMMLKKERIMMNCNWLVTLAIAQRKALIGFGYSMQQVNPMSLDETTAELKKLGYDFKANSPFKNK